MGIIEDLKNSSIGRIAYDRECGGEKLKTLLKECSSPPSLHVSPKVSNSLNNSSYIDEEKRIKEDNDDSREEKFDQEKICKDLSIVVLPNVSKSPSSRPMEDIRKVKVKHKFAMNEFGKSRLALQKYEEEMSEQAKKNKLQKQKEFEEAQRKIELEAKLKVIEIEQQATYDNQLRKQTIEERNETQAAEIVKQHRLLKETHIHRKQVFDATIHQAEQVRRKQQQEKLKKEQENKERQAKIAQCSVQLSKLSAKIKEEVNACKYQNLMSEAGKKSLILIEKCASSVDNLMKVCQDGEVTSEICEQCRKYLDNAREAYELVKKNLEKAEREGKEADAEKERQAKLQQEQAAAAAAKQNQTSAAGAPVASLTPTSSSQTSLGATGGQTLCVDIEAYKNYTKLMEKLEAVEQSNTVMSSRPELKKIKFDIQKAVNTPINAISPVSGEHLRDKLKRLLSLLAGQPVEVTGGRVSIKLHPQAEMFCKNLIARMIVKKGDEQVSSKHESAFAIGMVAAGLWRESPDIGDLLLAHFYKQCPYLVPYYIQKQEGQSDEDYFKSLGYRYENGVIEKQDKFLKRMSGIMRLYFSIIVSSPPRGEHPHGIQQAWLWITRVLNLEPESDITAAMIYDFLVVTGNMLAQTYRKQFLKLLHILVKEMLPKLKAVSSEAGSGSLTRLQMLLENSVKHHGEIPVPEGFLRSNFWLS